MPKSGDVVIAMVNFADLDQSKIRPAVVLFVESGNFVVSSITSNLKRAGIPLSKSEGAAVESMIRTDSLFTISESRISRVVFRLSKEKKQQVFDAVTRKLEQLKS